MTVLLKEIKQETTRIDTLQSDYTKLDYHPFRRHWKDLVIIDYSPRVEQTEEALDRMHHDSPINASTRTEAQPSMCH